MGRVVGNVGGAPVFGSPPARFADQSVLPRDVSAGAAGACGFPAGWFIGLDERDTANGPLGNNGPRRGVFSSKTGPARARRQKGRHGHKCRAPCGDARTEMVFPV
jgi:hypothetical protein